MKKNKRLRKIISKIIKEQTTPFDPNPGVLGKPTVDDLTKPPKRYDPGDSNIDKLDPPRGGWGNEWYNANAGANNVTWVIQSAQQVANPGQDWTLYEASTCIWGQGQAGLPPGPGNYSKLKQKIINKRKYLRKQAQNKI